jgi:hypothetical protein
MHRVWSKSPFRPLLISAPSVQTHTPIALVSLKAFGDFIIARWALRQLDTGTTNVTLIAGDHLAELDAALGSRVGTRYVRHGEGGVPALFDMNRLGVCRGVSSAVRLRRLIQELNLPSHTYLVFDKVSLRESFIAAALPTKTLPGAKNIYLAYSELLGLTATLEDAAAATGLAKRPARVGIFPGSRISAKSLPADVITQLIDICQSAGARPTVFALEGEVNDLSPGLPVINVPRRFEAMVQAVRSVGTVISADSMPAHMAEYFDCPVFVVSPVPNHHWLPLSCLATGRWALFDDLGARADLLHRLLLSLEPF